jgi:hypothetical protein
MNANGPVLRVGWLTIQATIVMVYFRSDGRAWSDHPHFADAKEGVGDRAEPRVEPEVGHDDGRADYPVAATRSRAAGSGWCR